MSYLERLRPTEGAKVLVTAGASGIGAAIASAFLEVGARVAVCDVDEAALDRFCNENPGALRFVTDVSDAMAVDKMFETLEQEFDSLDVLVNNAGIPGPTGMVDEIALDDIRRTLDVDLLGQFIVIRRAMKLIKKSAGASIINMSSVAGRLGYAMRSSYSASKWGIVGMTASLAKELGPDGIRVNAILPGVVRGKRMDGVIQARADAEGLTFAEVESEYVSHISLRRMVGPEDVAGTALFLSSPAASNISGQAISVCGNVETI